MLPRMAVMAPRRMWLQEQMQIHLFSLVEPQHLDQFQQPRKIMMDHLGQLHQQLWEQE